jgi:hypothetical protein
MNIDTLDRLASIHATLIDSLKKYTQPKHGENLYPDAGKSKAAIEDVAQLISKVAQNIEVPQ